MATAKPSTTGNQGPDLDAVVTQLTSIGTEIKALREALTPAPSVDQPDPAATATKDLVDGLQGSLLAVKPTTPPVTATNWDGTHLSGIAWGSKEVDGHFIALTLDDGRRINPREIDDGEVDYEISASPNRIFRMEISKTADGPCLGVGGPMPVDSTVISRGGS